METAVASGGQGKAGDYLSVGFGSGLSGTAQLRAVAASVLRFSRSTTFGNIVIVLFFVSQALDGALTYIGLRTFGPAIEGNPLLAWLMASFGEAPALAGAKLAAIAFGMVLHLASVHRAVALLTALYVSAAIFPWALILFVAGHLR
jgi:hypothetical protein